MPVIDTSNTIDTSVFLKSKLKKNMVGDNYYIENLQHKRNLDWEYRYNRVDIEEELEKQVYYTTEKPNYTPIEVVITNVKNDKGEDMGTDWAHLSFKNLKHPNGEGSRYRFSLDFPDMSRMDEEEKHRSTSIWICVNKSPIKAGNACTVRRCNTAVAMVGSPTLKEKDSTEIHYEPCILENEMKYMQVYYNQSIPVPQAEWYMIMQLNYFTNYVKINDRFVFGTIDPVNRDHNQVYKVKAVIKSTSEYTFIENAQSDLENTPTVIFALDKDEISPEDNFSNRVASCAPVYKVTEEKPVYVYYTSPLPDSNYNKRILQTETEEYQVGLFYNNNQIEGADFDFTIRLENIDEEKWGDYFEFEKTGPDTFIIHNLKSCSKGKLLVNAKCNDVNYQSQDYAFTIELGSFY